MPSLKPLFALCLLPTLIGSLPLDVSSNEEPKDWKPSAHKPFVPNVGQWGHSARFVRAGRGLAMFLASDGWRVDLADAEGARGHALEFTFEGSTGAALVGECPQRGRHHYFLGKAERWRADVPLYDAVRYEELYAGVDLRLRQSAGAPEYDLLLQPGADLSEVCVHVAGARGLSLHADGSLVIETDLGELVQPQPKTWQVDSLGVSQPIACRFVLLAEDRYGFVAPEWDSTLSLTIDPPLIWSTYVGDTGYDLFQEVTAHADGTVTVAGTTYSSSYPTTVGAYDRTYGNVDAVVSRFDPKQSGAAQLIYSTFLGGSAGEIVADGFVDEDGVATIAGYTGSLDLPTTPGAYARTRPSTDFDIFVSRIDPRRPGVAQLTFSTYFGGSNVDTARAVTADPRGVVTLAGSTNSDDLPMRNPYNSTYNPGSVLPLDGFVAQFDPARAGDAQLLYSTYLGGKGLDQINEVVVSSGIVTVAGETGSPDFPTVGAYSPVSQGFDGFVSQIDTGKSGAAQLVYSTFFGGDDIEHVHALSVDAGIITIGGVTASTDLPTTSGAFDRTFNGGVNPVNDAFLARLDPKAASQLIYSTYLGGNRYESIDDLVISEGGIVTISGNTASKDFPTTTGAFDRTHNGPGGRADGSDAFVARFDLNRSGAQQLMHSTFLGGDGFDSGRSLAVDAGGTAFVAGWSNSTNWPTTPGAYDSTYGGRHLGDGFITRLAMGQALYADRHELPLSRGGVQSLTIDAGVTHANRDYAIFGSSTGTSPGLNLLGVHIPLNPDFYTGITIGSAVPPVFVGFRGKLDAQGRATAEFQFPSTFPPSSDFVLHHAFVVHAAGRFLMVSNAVPVALKN